jgi:biopolymer transport protein ExbD
MKLIPSRAPLNIVPFIDIMLVLLCMVLSVSTFIAQGKIKVNLPDSKTQRDTVPDDGESKKLEISEKGEIFFDGKKMTADTLKEMLHSIGADVHIELRIDEKADFGLFVTVLDELRELHHENFSIATEKAEL